MVEMINFRFLATWARLFLKSVCCGVRFEKVRENPKIQDSVDAETHLVQDAGIFLATKSVWMSVR